MYTHLLPINTENEDHVYITLLNRSLKLNVNYRIMILQSQISMRLFQWGYLSVHI